MLGAPLLRAARRGALNMHGSLLPKFRGRAPVNWAILKGAHESGATLHYMVERADAGEIVDQLAVPILADDDAREVFDKVTVAAETVLARSLPGLIAGNAPRLPQPIEPGQYFGRRRPEDGRIDWQRPALEIHNLVRAVAPPFPGAFAQVDGERWDIHRTRVSRRARSCRGCAAAGGRRWRMLRGLRGRRAPAPAGGDDPAWPAGADRAGGHPRRTAAAAELTCRASRSRSTSIPTAARAKGRCGLPSCSSGWASRPPSSSAWVRTTPGGR